MNQGIITHSIISMGMASILMLATYIKRKEKGEMEKVTGYECGFNASIDKEKKVEVKYYLVAIIYIILDIEISYIYPWVMIIKEMKGEEYMVGIYIIYVLTIGFIYEWKVGALKW